MDTNDDQEIRQLFDDYLRMYASRDDRLTTYFSEEFSGFTGGGDFLVKDRGEWVAITRQDFAQVKDPLRIELKDLAIQSLSDTIAVTTGFFIIHLPIKDHILSRETARLVLIFRKESAGWKITHSSISIPYYLVREGEVYPLKELTDRNQKLEAVIAERTIQLSEANDKLQQTNEELAKEIAARKQLEEALRKSEAHYRQLYDNAPSGIYQIDFRTGKFTKANDVICEYLDCSQEEIISLSPYDVMTNESKQLLSERLTKMNAGEKVTETPEYEIIDKKGNRRWLQLNSKNIYDSEGLIIGADVVAHDITARNQAEQTLWESEVKFRQLVEQISDVIFEIDHQGTVLYFSPAGKYIFGYDLEEVVGKNFIELVHPDDRDLLARRFLELIAGAEYPLIYRLRNKSGDFRWVRTKTKPRIENGAFIGARGTLIDITDIKQTEQAMRESEENYRSLFQNASIGIFHSLPEGRFIRVNPALAQMMGYESPEEMISGITNISTQIYVDSKKRQDLLTTTMETAGWVLAENRYHRKDGAIMTANLTIRKVLHPDGTVAYLEGFVEDITEHQKMEEALRESEDRYRSLVENASDMVYRTDENGYFTFINPAVIRITGYEADDIIGKHYKMLVRPDTFKEAITFFANQLIKKIPNTYYEYPIITKDGHELWIGQNLQLIMEGDHVTGFQAVARDITERKQIEEGLIESEKRLKREQALSSAIIDSIPGTFYMLDENGRYARWNTYQRDEIVGKPDDLMTVTNAADTIHPDDRALIGDKIANILGNGVEEPVEGRVLLRGGPAFRWLLMTGRQMKIDGRPFLVGIGIDITEHKRMEEETKLLEERLQRSEKMESLGTLAGGVAHDLNNVLGIIVGYSELILDSVDESSPIKSHLVNIMNGGQKAAAIVDDLLTLARRGVQGRSIVNLNKIVAECQKSPEFANLSFHHPAVKIIADLETDLLNISGSSVHLGKSLYNLISNASEAMPTGGTVAIKTTNQYLDKPIQGYDQIRGGDYVVLSVSDMGEGISANDMKRIFEPFYTKKIMGRSGTGLGLAVVWGTVKDHNGYINVQSEEGKGSTFTLYFPVTREEITTEAVAVAISEYMGNGESILVVDDVKEQRDLAVGMLRTLNYSATSVSSGEEAVAYMKEHVVDLMVLDMIMDPGMDGLDTYRSILEIGPKQKAIIVSGFSESDRVVFARSLGAGAYVRKPYIKEKLGIAVRKELDGK